jgi:uncharacterized membrane protein YuzA (DUF378 family)
MPEGILYLVIGIPALYLSVRAILYLFNKEDRKESKGKSEKSN